jgi:ribosome maturation factor RimP
MNQPSKGSRQNRSHKEGTKGVRLNRGAKTLPDKAETLVAQMVEPITKEMGLELVEVTYTKEGQDWYLRIFIDRPEGIDLEVCQELSSKVNPLLDEVDFIEPAYFFEVSSPGLERPLKKEADFRRYQGNKIRISTYVPIAGQKVLEGILKGIEDDQVVLELKAGPIMVPLSQVASARLAVEF